MKVHSSLHRSLLLTLPLALLSACGDDENQDSDHDAGSHDGGAHDASSHDSGSEDGGEQDGGEQNGGEQDGGEDSGATDAGDETKSVTMKFAAVVASDEFACDQTFMLGTPAAEMAVLDMRMYVQDIKLLDASGNEVDLELAQDTPFQQGALAMLDFEDGTGSCEGNAETNRVVTGSVPAGEYTGVSFTLGVPFEANHQDVNVADSPLNVPALFWNWLGGYKFAKVDVAPVASDADSGTVARWNFHLGETDCPATGTTDAGMPVLTDPPSGECAKPNRATYVFESFDVDTDTLEVDLAALFDGSDLTSNAGGPPGCMSVPLDSADCSEIFSNLGLDYDTGSCDSDCSGQTLFSVK